MQLVSQQSSGDHAVGMVYRSLQCKEDLSADILHQGGLELRMLHERKDNMRIREDGVLELRICSGDVSQWSAVCPFVLRNTVIWQTHKLAHAGINRTLNRIRLSWYWPGMTADIRRVIKTCEVCQTGKSGGLHSNRHRHRMHAGRPWQKVAIDLVGPMPITSLGNKWILVLTDHFTRWQDAIAIPDATAPTCARILDERVFCYMGLPEQIHADQGAQFESQLMQELCMLWGVTKTHTTPYHSQANGVVERGNRGLGDSLRALLLTRGQEEWDLFLPQIMRAFRGTPHSVTGETANMLMLGRELRLPDLVDCNPSEAKTFLEHEYVVEMQERLERVQGILREQQMETRGEDTAEPLLYKVGDLVLLENKRRKKGCQP